MLLVRIFTNTGTNTCVVQCKMYGMQEQPDSRCGDIWNVYWFCRDTRDKNKLLKIIRMGKYQDIKHQKLTGTKKTKIYQNYNINQK